MTIVCWYRMSGEIADVSGNNHHGINNGGTYVNALVDKGLNLAGADNYATIPNTINGVYTAFHMAIKFNISELPSSEGHDYYLVSLNTDQISIYISTADDKIYAKVDTDSAAVVTLVDPTVVSINTNYDIQLAYDGSNAYLYISNTLVDSDVCTGTITIATSNHYIGSYYNVSRLARNPEGVVDEFRFYDVEKYYYLRNQIRYFNDLYDVRINGKSYTQQFTKGQYETNENAVSSDFKVSLFDPNKTIYGELQDDYDVSVFKDAVLVFRGQVDVYSNLNGITTVTGRDYTSILFSRYAIGKNYTSKTRQFIAWDLITSYLGQDKGDAYFAVVGTATGGSTTTLIDTNAVFNNYTINVGDIVFNQTDGETATVVTVDSDTQITHTALSGSASFANGEKYGVIPATFDEVTTNTVDKSYANTSLAEIFLTFANEEDAQLTVAPSVILPLSIVYQTRSLDPLQKDGVDVLIDFDTPANTTTGYRGYVVDFSQESKQIKNVFTVYGPGSSKIAASVRDETSIAMYGVKESEPITDVNATTPTLARQRALVEQAKWLNPINKGVIETNNNINLIAGKTIRITASKYNENESKFRMIEVKNQIGAKTRTLTRIKISETLKNVELVLANVLKRQREYDMRDADTDNTNVTSFLTHDFDIAFTFSSTFTGTGFTTDNSRIGSFQIGKSLIGNQELTNWDTELGEQTMLITNEGRNAIRGKLATGTTPLSQAYMYLQFGDVGTDVLDVTLTEVKWTTDNLYGVGVRFKDDTTPSSINVGTAYTSILENTTFTNAQLSTGVQVNALAIFDTFDPNTGNLIAVVNLSSTITKVSGSNIVPEIIMLTEDGA